MDIAPELGKDDITVVIDGQNVSGLELGRAGGPFELPD